MSMYVFDNRAQATQKVTNSLGTIRYRGTSTFEYPKKSYKIELSTHSQGNHSRNNNVSLLGMRQDNDWILYPAYNDQEKIRNVFCSNLWKESCADNNLWHISNGVEYKYVELFINNEYAGLYALGYPVDNKQLNIGNAEFSFKKDGWDFTENEDCINGFSLASKNVDETLAWNELKKYFSTMKTSQDISELYELCDIENIINYYLFINFIQGVDNAHEFQLKNTYVSLKKYNGKYVVLYTPWDLDLTFGNSYDRFIKNSTLQYNIDINKNFISDLNVIYYLNNLGDTNINNMIVSRYNELRNTYWSDEHLNYLIDDYEMQIYDSGAFSRDSELWPEGNYNESSEKLSTFRNRVINRIHVMDEYIYNLNEHYEQNILL